MPSVDAYLSDYLAAVAGVLGGNIVFVSLAAVLNADLLRYLGIARAMPDFLPGVLAIALGNLIAAIELSVLPALGILVVLYADYRGRPGE
ncbi:MAG: hypothetical protein ABEH66_04555 [Halobacteriales archaeon]